MRPRTALYLLKEGVRSLFMNGWMTIAALSTVIVSLLVLGSFVVAARNLEYLSSVVESQLEITVFLREDISDAELDEFTTKLFGEEGIAEARFVSKEEALENLKDRLGERADLLDGLDGINPLRDSYEIRVTDPETIGDIADEVRNFPGVAEVKYGHEIVERLLKVTKTIRYFAWGAVTGLAVAGIFVISNTVHLTVYARRKEIQIMKLVGATDWFIRWPFVIEGLLLGVLSAAAAGTAVYVAYGYLWSRMQISIPFLQLLPAEVLGYELFKILGLLGAAIGALGSGLAIRRFLRV